MSIEPMTREELGEHEALFAITESILGYVPNSMLTMGRKPELLYAFSMLTSSVLGEKPKASMLMKLQLGIKLLVRIARLQQKPTAGISDEMKWLVAYVTSRSAGCRYCQGHTALLLHQVGVSDEKILAAFEFEESDLFTERERAALRIALVDGSDGSPSREMFATMEDEFSENEVIEIVSIISLFGFLNRWNSLMGTELEALPRGFVGERKGMIG